MEKILVVDDSPVQAAQLKSILDSNFDVVVAQTAEEGLRLASAESFALILLDVVMPGMDGFTLLKKLQEEVITRNIPVILITSLSDEESEERGLVLGAVDYISKPFKPLIVKARVNTHINLYQYRVQVKRQASLDQLTGVANRRHYNTVSPERWQEAVRLNVPISIGMMDIDKFKIYNDTFGHVAGDKVIADVAGAAAARLQRTTDFFARYGGEEFVMIIMGCTAADTFEHMKGIRQAVEDLHIRQNEAVSPYVTVSIGGVTLYPSPRDSYDTQLEIADTMLYDAKRFGRNQVVWYSDQLELWREHK